MSALANSTRRFIPPESVFVLCPRLSVSSKRSRSSSALSRSEEHTSELQSHSELVCRLLLEKKNVLTSLKEGRLVALAAEGTRHLNGGLCVTIPVLARLPIQASPSGIPLIPLAAVGTYQCLPRGAWFPRPGK